MPTIDAFEACLAFTKTEEGGYTCDPADSGNWSTGLAGHGSLIGSNMGVSAPTLIAWLGRDDSDSVNQYVMQALPVTTYRAIARARYWRSLACDEISPSVAMMIFDFGWNVGVGKSARLLQTMLGLTGSAVDGDLGAQTQLVLTTTNWPIMLHGMAPSSVRQLQAICALEQDGLAGPSTGSALEERPDLWPLAVALRLAQEQTRAYERLANFSTYGKGWLSRTSKRLAAATALMSIQDRAPTRHHT